jgi:hypothetical protein
MSNRLASRGEGEEIDGLTIVKPRQVEPLWKSSESSSRQRFSAATAKTRASHIGNSWSTVRSSAD